MNYDLEAIDYKIPHEEESHNSSMKQNSSGRTSRLQVKGMLERYRKETLKEESQSVILKQKLSEAYEKLSKEIELNNSNCQLVDELQQMAEAERKESSKLKQILQSVIENRKHLEREVCSSLMKLTACQEQLKAAKANQQVVQAESETSRQQLDKRTRQLQQTQQELKQFRQTFEHRTLSDEKVKLQRMLLDRDSELLKLREENKKLNYLHIENLNLLKQIEKLKGNSLRGDAEYTHSSHPYTDENSGSSINEQPQQHVIGKWKKPSNASTAPNSNAQRHGRREFSRQAEFSIENELTESQRPQPMRQTSLPQSSLTIDECLTIQQRRKEQLESELNKLTNIKKLTPMERRAIDELERDLYDVNSQIAGLKRKIRHRY